jgi:hypothetical protein
MMPIALLAILVLAAALMSLGPLRWNRGTQRIRKRIEASRLDMPSNGFDHGQLGGLPPPVRRYFSTALADGQPMIASALIEHAGTFNTSVSGERWRPFTSTQLIVIRRPGFDWDGRIAFLPGLTVRVHDAYIAGEGVLVATLFGLVPLMRMRGTPEIAAGQLMRHLAEAPCCPTALLPSQGVRWEAVDDRSAVAILEDGPQTVDLLFRFREDGLIGSVRSESRGRTVGRKVVPMPWEGSWSGYERRNGMLIPTEGEVAWITPEGRIPYWRGRIKKIEYLFQGQELLES